MNGNRKEGLDVVDLPAPNGWKIQTEKNWPKKLTVHVYSPFVMHHLLVRLFLGILSRVIGLGQPHLGRAETLLLCTEWATVFPMEEYLKAMMMMNLE